MHLSASNPLNQHSVETTLKHNEMLIDARILLTADNSDEQFIASQLLEERGALVAVANSGLEAVEFVSSDIFDLVLMDLQMADMDGYETTKRLRALHQGKELPIIAMSAEVSDATKSRIMNEGINGIVGKPLNFDELYDILSNWLGVPSLIPEQPTNPDSSVQWAIPAKMEGVDLPIGLKNAVGEPLLYLQVLKSFYNQFHAVVIALRESSSKEEGRHISHSLKGVTSTIGATGLSEIASKLEMAFRGDADDSEIETLINTLESIITPILIDIEPLISIQIK